MSAVTGNAEPVVVLVRPQLGENIGAVARAMGNFAMSRLRLVAPRDGWPNPDAGPTAAGADYILDGAEVFGTTAEAVADCHDVYATTIRPRDMVKPVINAAEAAERAHECATSGHQAAYLFGPERSGLANDDIVRADAILTIAVNPDFGSLNLAQAVILCTYELFGSRGRQMEHVARSEPDTRATQQQLDGLAGHLWQALDRRSYFHPEERRPALEATMRNLIQSSNYTDQQVRTLRGIIKTLDERPLRKS
ncbi:MAG: RNA methyltransferase [Pseudomonadota bacterium]